MPRRKKGEEEPEIVEQFHCVVCSATIPRERALRKSVTCSDEHSELLMRSRRAMKDRTRCRLCNRPTTPEEIASYRAWRRATEGETRGRKNKVKAEEESADQDAPAEAHSRKPFASQPKIANPNHTAPIS